MIDGEPMSAARWTRSSYCDSAGLDCVEVALCTAPVPSVRVRDSKFPVAATLAVAPGTWTGFIDGIQRLPSADSPR
ncbi:conserved hypothetical protein [Streptomyces scabiei 87.22]|uniref:DUF397 domain-containing protein n=1 Tax=Streptomyces scabiei (strain 87.22) TaxID=680198 RepID=C9YTL0_STRSW|nr:conserved hypothetical protein [Streptomyces scabiei 87.22]